MDQSLNSTGISYRVDGRPVTRVIDPGKLRGLKRLSYIRKQLLSVIALVNPGLVVFEDYVMGFRKGTGRLAHLGELGGVLKLTVYETGIDLMVVPTATLKSLVAGNGSAKKPDVIRALAKKYGYHVAQEDEADALSLMLIGEAKCGSTELKAEASRMASLEKCEVIKGQPKLRS